MNKNKWISVVMFALALGYLAGSFLYPLGSFTSPGPGFFPLVIGLAWSIISGVVVLVQWRTGRVEAVEIKWKISPGVRRGAVLVAGVAAFIIILPVIGYLISSVLLTFFLLKVLGIGGLIRPASYSLAWGAATYWLFVVIMKIPIPG